VLNRRYNESLPEFRGIAFDAIETLLHHSWPGNVRELFNVLERAFMASAAPHIRLSDLGLLPLSTQAASLPDFASGTPTATLAESERALLAATLDSTGGNKSHAARRLGISRKKLYARISKYAL